MHRLFIFYEDGFDGVNIDATKMEHLRCSAFRLGLKDHLKLR